MGAAQELSEKFNVPIYGHPDDEMFYKDILALGDFGMPNARYIKKYTSIKDKEEFRWGSQKITVIHTPGHSNGSVCYYFENILISGDTLFRNSVGRTDFPQGEYFIILLLVLIN